MDFIDLTVSHSQQSTELLCPFRPMLLLDAPQSRSMLSHHRHSLLPHGAWMTVGTPLPCTATAQTGDVAFHHRAARATGTGPLHVVRGPLPVEARRVAAVVDLLSTGMWVKGLDALGEANREPPALMERLTPCRVLDAKVTRARVELGRGRSLDTRDGALDLVEPGQPSAGIVRLPRGPPSGPEQARGWFRRAPGRATTWSGARARAFEEGSAGELVGRDTWTVAEFFPVGELGGCVR